MVEFVSGTGGVNLFVLLVFWHLFCLGCVFVVVGFVPRTQIPAKRKGVEKKEVQDTQSKEKGEYKKKERERRERRERRENFKEEE